MATSAPSAGPQVSEIHQYFYGSYATEGEAGRKIRDALQIDQRRNWTAGGGRLAVSRGRA